MPASGGRGRRRRRGGRRLTVQALAGGRYRVERELGHGGMASVFLAHDEELDRPVAVKVLAAHLASEPGLYERFVREARMAASFSHPNVVQVFDAGEEDDRPYIVMEYVPGRTMADELRSSGKLDTARVVDIALQVCGGLELAHSSGLVHRDVKPQNLLLRDDGTVKIADFGIARAVEATNLTQIGSILGTAAYLSPEQAEGEPVTAAADIYSLGVVLYELLTGRTPHEFSSLADLVVKQREQPVRPLSDLEPSVPQALEAVVMRCLARNPDYRPASAAELARELAAASPEPPTVPLPRTSGVRATDVATAPLRASTPLPPAAAAVRARRERRDFALPTRGVLAAVLVAILVAVVVGFALWSDGDGSEPAREQRPTVEPVPQAGDPGDQARNLADWLRENSR
ncbi:MAG TPA: protein kinase [Gaiellaceae bacterium]|nr:protein kinase [Gaiellaceae bacterium]